MTIAVQVCGDATRAAFASVGCAAWLKRVRAAQRSQRRCAVRCGASRARLIASGRGEAAPDALSGDVARDNADRLRLGTRLLGCAVVSVVSCASCASLAQFLANALLPQSTDGISVLVNGSFIPPVGLLLGTLISNTVGVLRQRQQDVRQTIHDELGTLLALALALPTPAAVAQIEQYIELMRAELWGEKGRNAAARRTQSSAAATEMLYALLDTIAKLRMRDHIDHSVASLITLRAQRFALIETSYPGSHYSIMALLGLAALFAYLLVVGSSAAWTESVLSALLFALLNNVYYWTAILVADLRDLFFGSYSVDSVVVDLMLERVRQRRIFLQHSSQP